MAWFSLALAALVAVVVLGVVGGALSWAVGLRGLWAVGAAPAFALTAIGVASVVAPWVGLSWSAVPVVIVTVVLAAVLSIIRRRWVRPAPAPARAPRDGWVIVATLLALVAVAARVLVVIGDPSNFSQTFDNIFHLNGVRFILDTGNASSLHLGQMTSPSGTLPFYPAAWHALTSLVVGLSGVSIPIGVNAVTLVIAAVIWPLGILLLTRTLFGTGRVLMVSAAVAAAGIPAFPLLLMDYGVLYPYQLGLALVPVALAAALRAMGLTATVDLPRPWWALILAGTLPGIALAHPGAFVAVLALTLPMVALFTWRLLRAAKRWPGRLAVVIGAIAYGAVGILLLKVLRPPLEARQWPPVMTPGEAVLQILGVSLWYGLPVLVIAAAVIVGVVFALMSRRAPGVLAVAMYVGAGVLFVAVSSFTAPQLRDLLTGSWYNNIPRLAAILPLTMVPLAAYGAARTWALIRRATLRVGTPIGRAVTAVGLVAGVVAAAAVLSGPVVTVSGFVAASYRVTPDAPLISTDELALIDRIDQHVPPGVAIAGSAWTGAGLAYALADRPVLMPHTLMENSPALQAINDGLDDAVAGDAACAAVQETGVGFVLDFGVREVHPGRHDYPGLDRLASSGAVQLVDSEGDARLYAVTACGG